MDDDWGLLVGPLAKLKATWPGGAWSWDARFSTIASTFEATAEAAARASAMLAFPHGWTAKTIDTAPPELVALAARTGLRAGQRLLAGDAGLFGLWWPWGGGDKITLRIGRLDRDPAALRDAFGVR